MSFASGLRGPTTVGPDDSAVGRELISRARRHYHEWGAATCASRSLLPDCYEELAQILTAAANTSS